MNLSEVMDYLQISESTARRLFIRMDEEGKVIRIHGGIQLPVKTPMEYSFETVVRTKMKEKNIIGIAACSFVQDGDIIFCDAGTTVLCFCMELAHQLEQNPMDIKVYTNSLANFELLSSSLPITLIGGEYRPLRKDFRGYLTEMVLSRIHFTKCFLGTDGCDMKQFFTTTDFDTARMGETVIRNSDETMILCDSGKFSVSAVIGYAAFAEVDRVITDEGILPDERRALEAGGLDVVVAEMGTESIF